MTRHDGNAWHQQCAQSKRERLASPFPPPVRRAPPPTFWQRVRAALTSKR